MSTLSMPISNWVLTRGFHSVGKMVVLIAVVIGGALPMAATAYDETYNAQLRTNFEAICDNDNTSYDVTACREWVSNQTQEDQAYLESYYVTGVEPELPDVARQGKLYTAKKLDTNHFQGSGTVERKTFGVPNWSYTVIMEWCQNDAGTKISGCKSSRSVKRTFVVWDFLSGDETKLRTNATSNSWTRIYYQGHFKSSGVFGQLAVHCWPEVEMTARAQTLKPVLYTVDEAKQNCS